MHPLCSKTGLLAAPLLLGLCACASYTQRTAQAMSHFQAGQLDEARAQFEAPETAGAPFLQAAESGTVALTAGDWIGAREWLEAAALEVRELEERALLSATDLGESILSLGLNEGVKTYHGEGYERVMLHVMLAMTYLAEGKAEDAWVESKRANKLLESEEKLYEKSYAAGGMGNLLSAVSYEMKEEWSDAYIDYKRMHEKGVGLELAGRALVRLGTLLDRDDELPGWIDLYGPDLERPEGAASIVLLAGVGTAPYKVEIGITIPTFDGVIKWAVPSYERRPQPIESLRLLEVGSGIRVGSSLVEDVGAVAKENLDDRIAWLAVKSAARAALKYEATRRLTEEHGAIGWLGGALFTAATEQADLRSWLTLPDSWHGARMFVEPGVHELALEAVGGSTEALGTYEVDPGETMIVLARTIERRTFVYTLGGRRLDQEPPQVPEPEPLEGVPSPGGTSPADLP